MEATEKKPKILIVDDDPLTLKLLTGVLESQNYEVVQARNGEDALAIAVLDEPNATILTGDVWRSAFARLMSGYRNGSRRVGM